MPLQKTSPLPVSELDSQGAHKIDDSWADYSSGTLSPKSPLTEDDFRISPKTKVASNSDSNGHFESELIALPTERRDGTSCDSMPNPQAYATDTIQDTTCSNPHDLDAIKYKALSPPRPMQQSPSNKFMENHPDLFANFTGWGWEGLQNEQFASNKPNYSAGYQKQYVYPNPIEAMAHAPYLWPTRPNLVPVPAAGSLVNNGAAYFAHQQLGQPGMSLSQPQTNYPPAVAYSQLTAVPGGNFQPSRQSAASEDTERLYSVDRDNRHKKYRAEKPTRDDEHNWLRKNNTTVGLSTRTGKINSYDPNRDGKYCNTEHPTGDWTSVHGTAFKYTRFGELQRLSFSAHEIQEFLFEHPLATASKGRLTLWIQKTPADSGRRYPTAGSNKCRFKDCPASVFSRAIGVGHFRVAIDEQWETCRASRDPYIVSMYVHLYCLERFCSFPLICNMLNVRADNRELISEPKGNFMPALDCNQVNIADTFIKACQLGRQPNEYPDYPQHDFGMPTAKKDHTGTLTCALTDSKNDSMNNAKIAMMEARGLSESNLLVNRGDLQMAMDARQAANKSKRRQKKEKGNRSPLTRKRSGSIETEERRKPSTSKDRSRKSPLSSRESPPKSTRETVIKALSHVVETRDKENRERAARLALLQTEAHKRRRSMTVTEADRNEEQRSSKRARIDAVASPPKAVVEPSQTRKTRSPSKSTVRNFYETFGTYEDFLVDPDIVEDMLPWHTQNDVASDPPKEPALLKDTPKAVPEDPVFF